MNLLARVSASIRQRALRSSGVVVVAAYYALLLLPFAYSRHSWAVTHLDRPWGIVPLLHAELGLPVLLAAFLVVFVPSLAVSVSLLTTYYYLSLVNFLVWSSVSRPFHPVDITRIIDLMTFFPAFASLSTTMLAGVVVFVVLPVPVALLVLHLWQKTVHRLKTVRRGVLYGSASFLAIYLAIFPLVVSASYFRENSLVRMFHEMAFEYRLKNVPVHRDELNALLGQPGKGDRPGGKQDRQGGMNIVMFVMETAPYPHYRREIDRFVHELNHTYPGHTVSLREHYTTYPESNRALLSMLTGEYPALERGSGWFAANDFSYALPKILKGHGYRTYLLSTAPLDYQDDRTMMRNLWFDVILEKGSSGRFETSGGDAGHPGPASLYQADQAMLHDALQIMRSNRRDRFLLVLLPQGSHSPFNAPPGYSGDGSQESLIKANALWQLNLVREIMRCAAESGQAARTCFIFTGDHGLRHPSETSLFEDDDVNWLTPLTFHVPFVLLSPRALPEVRASSTSHIDITPTILELNGLPYEADRYHGRSMFRQVRRLLFFLGGECLPVSGFKKDGTFFMEHRIRGLVLKSPSMEFRAAVRQSGVQALACSEVDRARISSSLNLMRSYLFHPRTSPPGIRQQVPVPSLGIPHGLAHEGEVRRP